MIKDHIKQSLQFIGRGNAFNVKEGNTSAFMKVGKSLILFDCGEGIFERLIKYKILEGVNNILLFLTHLHSDHVGSVSSLAFYCEYVLKCPLVIYHPQRVSNFFTWCGNEASNNICFVELNSNRSYSSFLYKDGYKFNITPIRVKHTPNIKCYGYLLCDDYNRIWYSGDCNEISDIALSYNPTEIYQDTCLADYNDNVHLSLKKLLETLDPELYYKTFCMHIDNKKLIKECKKHGLKVVKKYNPIFKK